MLREMGGERTFVYNIRALYCSHSSSNAFSIAKCRDQSMKMIGFDSFIFCLFL